MADVIIGAIGGNSNGNTSGSSYVVFGKSTLFAATLALSSLNGSNGFRLIGVTDSDKFGGAVSAAGDINGDEISDVIIGAPGSDLFGSSSGSSYVLFGKREPFAATMAMSGLNTGPAMNAAR